MNARLPAPFARRIVLPLATAFVVLPAIAVLVAAQSSSEPVQLDELFVTATRTPVCASELGTSIEYVSGEDLARQQISSLQAALGGAPGLPLFASGATGAATSLFMRGANSNQTLFLVDGLRLNDPNTDYGVFLGGAAVSPTDGIEIARGPQGTLYGGEAIGGVVSLRTAKGEGAPSARVDGGGGVIWHRAGFGEHSRHPGRMGLQCILAVRADGEPAPEQRLHRYDLRHPRRPTDRCALRSGRDTARFFRLVRFPWRSIHK